MFWRWWRIEQEDRRRVWQLYGWFSGLMCVGSVFGAVTWGAWMMVLVFNAFIYSSGLVPAAALSQVEFQALGCWGAVCDWCCRCG